MSQTITNEAVMVEYQNDHIRITNEAVMVEYAFPGISTVAIMVEYVEEGGFIEVDMNANMRDLTGGMHG